MTCHLPLLLTDAGLVGRENGASVGVDKVLEQRNIPVITMTMIISNKVLEQGNI